MLDEELEYEGGILPWEMAARAGFTAPPEMAIKMKRAAAVRSRLAKRQIAA